MKPDSRISGNVSPTRERMQPVLQGILPLGNIAVVQRGYQISIWELSGNIAARQHVAQVLYWEVSYRHGKSGGFFAKEVEEPSRQRWSSLLSKD